MHLGGGSWMGTAITGSWVVDWHQSELHLVVSSYLVLCLLVSEHSMEKGRVWDWAIPLWSSSLDPVCVAEPGLTHAVPP